MEWEVEKLGKYVDNEGQVVEMCIYFEIKLRSLIDFTCISIIGLRYYYIFVMHANYNVCAVPSPFPICE
jgi:hypothetical protein